VVEVADLTVLDRLQSLEELVDVVVEVLIIVVHIHMVVVIKDHNQVPFPH
tara:strand:- start:261 stop:410 length:150 start_codon:yes stop_codon:yes gene_type:complete